MSIQESFITIDRASTLDAAESELIAAIDKANATIKASDYMRECQKVLAAANKWRKANAAWDTEHTLDLGGGK